MKTIRMRRFESTGRTWKVTPRMMEYLATVIDTPTVGVYGDNGKAPDAVIGKKMGVTNRRVGNYRNACSRWKREEIAELCEEILKEAS